MNYILGQSQCFHKIVCPKEEIPKHCCPNQFMNFMIETYYFKSFQCTPKEKWEVCNSINVSVHVTGFIKHGCILSIREISHPFVTNGHNLRSQMLVIWSKCPRDAEQKCPFQPRLSSQFKEVVWAFFFHGVSFEIRVLLFTSIHLNNACSMLLPGESIKNLRATRARLILFSNTYTSL